MREKIVLLALLLAALVFGVSFAKGFYLTNTEAVPNRGGNYTEGLLGQPNLINPLFSSINSIDRDLENLLFSRLFRYDENRQLVPDLVGSYEIADDKKSYTIKIKRGVFWHDHNNEELKADDIIFTVHRLLDPQTKSPLFISLNGVTIEKIDDYSFKLNLKEPYAPFLSNLTFGILPAHIWETYQPTGMILAKENLLPIGSGLFQMDKLTKDKKGNILSFVLKRNERYYGPKPYLDKITFKFFNDSGQLVTVMPIDNLSVPIDLIISLAFSG